MKISWGIKITLLYSGFVILILCMVGLTMTEKVDLVAKNYYEQELKFQDKIDKLNRTARLKESLTWEVKEKRLLIKFPLQFKGQKKYSGLYFFNPSDAKKDRTIFIPADTSGIQEVSTASLKEGLYKLQVDWKVNGEEYYNEGFIQIH